MNEEREVRPWPHGTRPVGIFPATPRPVRPWSEEPAPDEDPDEEPEEQP